jgi:hypothetical protein
LRHINKVSRSEKVFEIRVVFRLPARHGIRKSAFIHHIHVPLNDEIDAAFNLAVEESFVRVIAIRAKNVLDVAVI